MPAPSSSSSQTSGLDADAVRALVRERLAAWRGNDARLRPLMERSGLLKELAPLSEGLTALAQAGLEALDAPARAVAKSIRGNIPPGPVKDALSGTWLGHALHPLTTDLPIGVGLGVSNGDQAASIARYADGVLELLRNPAVALGMAAVGVFFMGQFALFARHHFAGDDAACARPVVVNDLLVPDRREPLSDP